MKKIKVDKGLKGQELPDPAEIIRQGREMRDVQLFMAGMGEQKMLELARKHGLSWGVMSEAEREQFVDNLLHEKS
jgi:hypothetical protein